MAASPMPFFPSSSMRLCSSTSCVRQNGHQSAERRKTSIAPLGPTIDPQGSRASGLIAEAEIGNPRAHLWTQPGHIDFLAWRPGPLAAARRGYGGEQDDERSQHRRREQGDFHHGSTILRGSRQSLLTSFPQSPASGRAFLYDLRFVHYRDVH